MGEELKPCPFCASEAEIDDYFDQAGEHVFVVKCLSTDCAGRTDFWLTTGECIVAWNTRPTEDALRGKVSRLQAQWDAIPREAIEDAAEWPKIQRPELSRIIWDWLDGKTTEQDLQP